MNSEQLVKVFDNAELIRDAVSMLCRDRLPRAAETSAQESQTQKSAIDQLCWDLVSLQSKNFPFRILQEKCAAMIGRSPYAPMRNLRAEELANEISSPLGGW